MTSTMPDPVPPPVPYRGIESFRYVDGPIFFARELETRALVRQVAVYRGVLFYGESGLGKSSLVNAGFIPAALDEGLTADRLRVQPSRGRELIVERIPQTGERDGPFLRSNFPDGTGELAIDALKEQLRAATGDRRPLLIFDQFEELVTRFEGKAAGREPEDGLAIQARILNGLADLLHDPELAVKLLFVFREDHLGKLTKLFELSPELLHQYLRLTPVPLAALHGIIRGPFERFPGHYDVELSGALAQRITDAFEARGELNLTEVQIACLHLWQSKRPDTLFEQMGVQGLLEDYLSGAIARFPQRLRDPAIALLGRMVTRSGTRNVVSEEDLRTRVRDEENFDEELIAQALFALENQARLVRRERRYEAYFFEIVSEFLVPWIRRQRSEVLVDERAFVARVEAAGVDEFRTMLAQPSPQQEKTLQTYLGDERYQRLHGLSISALVRRSPEGPRGNVVVIPGFLGSALTTLEPPDRQSTLWQHAPSLVEGQLERLRLAARGRTEHRRGLETRASGILKRHYGELLLSLADRWNVRAFWYDWRKDLSFAAEELRSRLNDWFGEDEPVHLVAHSTGGLVARTFIKNHPERWQRMRDSSSDGQRGGRLVMLGTPNHGSFSAVQMLVGLDGLVSKLASADLRHGTADLRHGTADLLPIVNSFVGIYQMLPSPVRVPSAEPLYQAKTYGGLPVSQRHLDLARAEHEALEAAAATIDPERLAYVAGNNRPTFDSVRDWSRLDALESYGVTIDGDGRVPHALGPPKSAAGQHVPTYYVEAGHGDLPVNTQVLAALGDLLTGIRPSALSVDPPATRRGRDEDAIRQRLRDAQQADDARIASIADRIKSRTSIGSTSAVIAPDERDLEELLTRDWLGRAEGAAARVATREVSAEVPTIAIDLHHGSIAEIDDLDGSPPVDAIAIGHYAGARPFGAALAVDQAISRALAAAQQSGDPPAEAELLLSQFAETGFLPGDLGQLFLLDDPRVPNGRAIVVAGMGLPGRFGGPELTILARALCWALGRLGKRHLATALIGAGNGNLPIREAVQYWLRGIASALEGRPASDVRRLERITFVEHDPGRMPEIQAALVDDQNRLARAARLRIDFQPLDEAALDWLKEQERSWLAAEAQRALERRLRPEEDPAPAHVTIGLDDRGFRFAAVSEFAVLPERHVPIDRRLVMQANDELAAESDPAIQNERGRFLQRLLVPSELKPILFSAAAVVLRLDSLAARIHWEMLAEPDLSSVGSQAEGLERTEFGSSPPDTLRFLGINRGLSRQLLSTPRSFPEPPPPDRRDLRVLVVADPAEDAPLPGAEEEGLEVADLFEQFNVAYGPISDNRVKVERLIGPRQATRTNVLRLLMLDPYDLLHFAGHCVYDHENPAASGWLFTGGQRVTAQELDRVDRVPRFVVSNASESGVTPDRAELRTQDLAPGFAEAFFARGVANFVCPAWPVDDRSARKFSLTLYAALLGLAWDESRAAYDPVEAHPMHAAMRQARLAVAANPFGVRAWGAYQHYGNPFLRLFGGSGVSRDQVGSPEDGEPFGPSQPRGRRRSRR